MSTFHAGTLCMASLALCAAVMPSIARADTDACSVLTPDQISKAVGVAVVAGAHVTPTYVKTCTWKVSASSNVKFVTLFLQTSAAYDGGKQMAAQMAATGVGIQPAAVGDDGYYFVTGDQVGLLVKKGSVSFKVAVYATLPVQQKEAMELALAKEAVAQL